MHSESQWRYRANRQGLRLVKYNKSSSAYELYGPYALVDQTTNRVARGHLRPVDVERVLFGELQTTATAVTA